MHNSHSAQIALNFILQKIGPEISGQISTGNFYSENYANVIISIISADNCCLLVLPWPREGTRRQKEPNFRILLRGRGTRKENLHPKQRGRSRPVSTIGRSPQWKFCKLLFPRSRPWPWSCRRRWWSSQKQQRPTISTPNAATATSTTWPACRIIAWTREQNVILDTRRPLGQ